MHKIFISYRREDSIETTGRVYDWLDSRLAPNSIFMDVDSIPPGADFRVAIKDTITFASVMLVVIGPRWLTVREPHGGMPRIDNPNDLVRAEVELAIQNNIPIIPILVQEATMPAADDLPASLISLAYRNAIKVRPNPDFQGDMIRVMKGIESIDSAIVFSQQAGKASEQVEKAPAKPEPELPPIPEGGTYEYGFYYTKVITRRIEEKHANYFVRKEFALGDSPLNKHEVVARFNFRGGGTWTGPVYGLAVNVDGTVLVDWRVRLEYATSKDGSITTHGPDYDKLITLDGHVYRVKFSMEGTTTYTKGKFIDPGLSWTFRINEFEVSVDGYTLLDRDSIWDY